MDLLKSRTIAQQSVEKSEEFERRLHEQLNESSEPTRRELLTLRSELVTRADQVTLLQHALEDERLKRLDERSSLCALILFSLDNVWK